MTWSLVINLCCSCLWAVVVGEAHWCGVRGGCGEDWVLEKQQWCWNSYVKKPKQTTSPCSSVSAVCFFIYPFMMKPEWDIKSESNTRTQTPWTSSASRPQLIQSQISCELSMCGKVPVLSSDQHLGRRLSFQPVGRPTSQLFWGTQRLPHLNTPFPLLETSVPGYIELWRTFDSHHSQNTTETTDTPRICVR